MTNKTIRIKFDIENCSEPLDDVVQRLKKQFKATSVSVVDNRDLLAELEKLALSFEFACAYKKSKRTDNKVLILTDTQTKNKIYCHVETKLNSRRKVVANSVDCKLYDCANSSAEMMLKIRAALGSVKIKQRKINGSIRHLPTGQIMRRPEKNIC